MYDLYVLYFMYFVRLYEMYVMYENADTPRRSRHTFVRIHRTRSMRIEFDRDTCIGMFQCVEAWDAFVRDEDAGKAILEDSEEVEADLFAREVPADAELDARFAARTCPVDAIVVYDEAGERLVP